ncbi:hypothetical protein F9U64_01580 [Gracilibacillus oryzae]|uniref:Uncharacterized protein n=1 Tax=Gracilibacillus oryzae TaxID=1672701 RepID=A0A7C8L1N9_9BACI|nr:hypothetical protein [Gracilibacillus oryzae]KAB8139114.1 hypothetical protein F9U64_01580 [Gracilibacillus oryzae]
MKKHKAVAYFATEGHQPASIFYDGIIDYCEWEKEQTDGYEDIELVAIFHDLNKKDDCDDLPAWEQFITFLVVNKDVTRVLLPVTQGGIKFDGADCLLDLSEFIDIPPFRNWFINDYNDPDNGGPIEIEDDDLPF